MSVTPITQKFDRDVDGVLQWMHEPTTAPTPLVVLHKARHAAETDLLPAYDAMLPGPATVLDAVPEPTPKPVKCWCSITWAFVIGFTTGTVYLALIERLTS